MHFWQVLYCIAQSTTVLLCTVREVYGLIKASGNIALTDIPLENLF